MKVPLKVKANSKRRGEKPQGSSGGVATQSALCHWGLGGIPAQKSAFGRGRSQPCRGSGSPVSARSAGERWAGLGRARPGERWARLAAPGDQRQGRKEGSRSQRMKSEKWQRFALEAAVWGYLRTMSGSTGWLLRALLKKKKKIQLMGAPPKQTRYGFHHAVPVEKSIILH